MCCLDCPTKAQVVALKFFQQDACEDDHWRSRGTVERVSETQDAYTCAAAVAMLVICTGGSSIQWPSDAGQAFVTDEHPLQRRASFVKDRVHTPRLHRSTLQHRKTIPLHQYRIRRTTTSQRQAQLSMVLQHPPRPSQLVHRISTATTSTLFT